MFDEVKSGMLKRLKTKHNSVIQSKKNSPNNAPENEFQVPEPRNFQSHKTLNQVKKKPEHKYNT